MGLGHSPQIVTNGMVLCLDAANPKNYNLTEVEVLVVAGGGSGGYGEENPNGGGGGGGGAGGLIYNRNFAVTPGSALTVTVGNGGASPSSSGSAGNSGGNSVFGSLTAIGGGAGGGGNFEGTNAGATGGSGGGAGGDGTYGSNIFSAGTAGQGFAGGARNGTTNRAAAGGGGAGGAGSSATAGPNGTGKGGAGGPGLGFNISGTFTYYAGGGGGGASFNFSSSPVNSEGGIGGGGSGGGASGAISGTANTGGGGGGGFNGTVGAGGSGIVIVRYPGPQKAIGGTVTSVAGHTIHTFTTVGSTTFTPLVATNNSTILGLSDFSGNGNFGTTANSPTYLSANGGSISFDGTDDYISVGSLGSQFTNFTVEIWFKSDSVASYRNPIDCNWLIENGSYSNLGPRLEQNSSGNLTWIVGSGSDVYSFLTLVSSGLSSTPYHHAVITKTSSTNFNGYYNGNYTSSLSFSGWAGSMLSVNIGRGFSASSERWFVGKIPVVKIYNRALSASEIQQNFQALRGRFGI